jgi:hypothetical protein
MHTAEAESPTDRSSATRRTGSSLATRCSRRFVHRIVMPQTVKSRITLRCNIVLPQLRRCVRGTLHVCDTCIPSTGHYNPSFSSVD